jgi:hypothetical protein
MTFYVDVVPITATGGRTTLAHTTFRSARASASCSGFTLFISRNVKTHLPWSNHSSGNMPFTQKGVVKAYCVPASAVNMQGYATLFTFIRRGYF